MPMTLFGLLNINKPSGVTSRRVVDQVQRLVRPAKVGHAGTLDPLACGVLVVGVGQATRLVEYVQQMPKHYRATFLLGRSSDTEDVEGTVIMLADARQPTRAELDIALAGMIGEISQRPPSYSALKIAGQRAYALARASKEVELAPRIIEIHRAQIERYEYPELAIDLVCGSGTYVRSFGRDLAEKVGSAAVMSSLVRVSIGCFTLDNSFATDEITRENLESHLIHPATAVRDLMPQVVVDAAQIARLKNGQSIEASSNVDFQCAAMSEDGRLAAILELHSDGSYRPAKYFPE